MDLIPTFCRGNAGQESSPERFASGDGNADPSQLAETRRVTSRHDGRSGTSWAADFLVAGISALLLLCANLFPHYWFLSLFALIPLLNRIIKAQPRQALRLGLFFGISFFGVSLIDLCIVSPTVALAKLAGGTALFALFGWAVAWGRRRWGFNPLIIALFWVVLDLGVIKLGFPRGLLAEGKASHPLFGGMVALFGFLSISFLIVLFNSLLIYALEAVITLASVQGIHFSQGQRKWDLFPSPEPIVFRLFLVPEGRAPPCLAC